MNKKLLLTGMLVAGAFVLPGLAGAAMQGVCSNCHTMHNSQNGAAMNASGGVNTPYDHLLKGSGCAGCHIQGVSNDASTGRATTGAAIGAPQVDDTANTLSGGYFSLSTVDNTHHNVTDAGMTADGALATAPGGGTTPTASPIACTSCHTGGGHHANQGNDSATWLDGTSVGASFRFLSGVQGVEDADFGVETSTDANVYYGEARAAGSDTAGNGTISELCGRCHGAFHTDNTGNLSNNGVWLRHPTDVDMPTAYETNYGTAYNPAIPVATTNTANTTFSKAGFQASEAVVICLSCHVAHGNANADMLRFDYSLNQAGDTTQATGCETCHGKK